MDFSMEDTQNSAPDAPTMAEVNKLSTSVRKADTQSVTKRYVTVLLLLSCPSSQRCNEPTHSLKTCC
jgi:ubiquitin-conjugating enzyme E2 C